MKILFRSHFNSYTSATSYGEILLRDRWIYENWITDIFGIDDYILEMISDENFVFRIIDNINEYMK